jgi:hypothetical protein
VKNLHPAAQAHTRAGTFASLQAGFLDTDTAPPPAAHHRQVHRPPQSAGVDIVRDSAITAAGARTVQRWDGLANVTMAVVLGLLGTAALWHWLSTCSAADAATLCAGAASTPLFRWRDWAGGLRAWARRALQRLNLRWQVAYIEHRLAVIEEDLAVYESELGYLPKQIEFTTGLQRELAIELMLARAALAKG